MSSIPSVAHITASSLTSIEVTEDSQTSKFELIFSETVIASRPYTIEKLNAVVSYIIEEPSLRTLCFSSISTSSSISASNSIIAAIRGASAWRFGIIILPGGIVKFSSISPVCFKIFFTRIGLLFL